MNLLTKLANLTYVFEEFKADQYPYTFILVYFMKEINVVINILSHLDIYFKWVFQRFSVFEILVFSK
jgi:hypothetical protein